MNQIDVYMMYRTKHHGVPTGRLRKTRKTCLPFLASQYFGLISGDQTETTPVSSFVQIIHFTFHRPCRRTFEDTRFAEVLLASPCAYKQTAWCELRCETRAENVAVFITLSHTALPRCWHFLLRGTAGQITENYNHTTQSIYTIFKKGQL